MLKRINPQWDYFVGKVLREHFPWVSPVSAHLVSRRMTAFLLHYLFKDMWWTASENRDRVPPEQRAGLCTVQYNKESAILHSKNEADLLSIRKDLGALSSGLLSHNPLWMQVSLGLFHTTLGDWDSETGINAEILLLLWVTKSFVSDSEGSYPLPAATKLIILEVG